MLKFEISISLYRKRKPTPVLAYLIFQAISMAFMVVFIVLMVTGLIVAGSATADDIAQGKYDLDGGDGSRSIVKNIVELTYTFHILFLYKMLFWPYYHFQYWRYPTKVT